MKAKLSQSRSLWYYAHGALRLAVEQLFYEDIFFLARGTVFPMPMC